MMEELETFAAAAESPSFSATARRLAVPASSVLRRIEALERRLGVPLFVRTTRRLALTDAGRAFHASVQAILHDIEAAEQRAAAYAARPQGTLCVETRTAMGARLLAPLLPGFLRLYPDISLDLRLTDEVGPALREGTDVAIRLELGDSSSLLSRKLAQSRRTTFASPAYLAAHGRPTTPDDLRHHNCLTYAAGPRPATWTFRARAYHRAISPPGNFRTNSVASICTAALLGAGIAVQHHWAVADDLASGALVQILEDYEVTTMATFDTPIYALFHRHSSHSPKLRALLDYLGEALQHR